MAQKRRHQQVVNLDEVKIIKEEQPPVGYFDDEPLAQK